jgi:hypothetical protein
MIHGACSYLLDSGELVEAFMHVLPDGVGAPRPKRADARLVDAIQTLFLRPQQEYSLEELRLLFSESLADCAASLSGLDVDVHKMGGRMPWRDAGLAVLTVYPASVIEDALGDEADRLLPRGYRTEIVKLRLPRHVIEDLQQQAQKFGLADITAVIENEFGRGDDSLAALDPTPSN